jgi:hypothetical protein
MAKTALDLSGKDFQIELDITIPKSNKKKLKCKWPYDTRDDDAIIYSPTLSLTGAKGVCKNLPPYAKVTNVRAFSSKDSQALVFYTGPMEVPEDKYALFYDERLKKMEKMVPKLVNEMKQAAKDLTIVVALAKVDESLEKMSKIFDN